MLDSAFDIAKFEPYRDELHDQAQQRLLCRLASDPHDVRVLMELGRIYRSKGDFTAALDVYRRASRIQGPDRRQAVWLAAMLGGDTLPHVPPPGIWPAPFVRILGFLSPAEHGRVLTRALTLRAAFSPARTGGVGRSERKVRTSEREGLAIDNVADEELAVLLVPKVRNILPSVFERLLLVSHDLARIDLDMTHYPNGGFSIPHCDSLLPPLAQSAYGLQSLICIYYFHRQPKAFAGGDLLVYDSDIEKGAANSTSFSRIEPVANSLVIYPTRYFHGITRVECGTADFADGRFAVTLCPRRQNDRMRGEAAPANS